MSHCVDTPLADGGEVVSLTRRPRFNPQSRITVLEAGTFRVSIVIRLAGKQTLDCSVRRDAKKAEYSSL
jgi:hypothetical protein